MNNIPYTLITIIVLAVLALVLMVLWIKRGKRPGKPMSKLGLVSFLLVIAGIAFGTTRVVGYGLIGAGLIVAIVDIVLKSRVGNLIEEQAEKKEENLNKIKEFIKSKNEVSNNDIEKLLGVSDATATRYLEELEKQGVLKQVGKTGKYTHYKKV